MGGMGCRWCGRLCGWSIAEQIALGINSFQFPWTPQCETNLRVLLLQTCYCILCSLPHLSLSSSCTPLFLSKLLRNVFFVTQDRWMKACLTSWCLTSWCIKLDGCSNDALCYVCVCVLNMIVLSDCVQMRVFCKFWGQKVSSPFCPPVSGSGCRWTSVSWGHYRNQETTQLTKWWRAVLFTCPPPRLPD